jgi:NADH-quinone oxidoreductase subunit J
MLEISLFSIFAIVGVLTGIMVITQKNPVISALFLIINFFSIAGLYLLLNAQFLAVVQVIVYAGAIMVLFLFVLMLLNLKNEVEFKHKIKKSVVNLSIVLGLTLVLEFVLLYLKSPIKNNITNIGTIEHIGKVLYTDYSLPFLSIGFLLISATIGAILLAKRDI